MDLYELQTSWQASVWWPMMDFNVPSENTTDLISNSSFQKGLRGTHYGLQVQTKAWRSETSTNVFFFPALAPALLGMIYELTANANWLTGVMSNHVIWD